MKWELICDRERIRNREWAEYDGHPRSNYLTVAYEELMFASAAALQITYPTIRLLARGRGQGSSHTKENCEKHLEDVRTLGRISTWRGGEGHFDVADGCHAEVPTCWLQVQANLSRLAAEHRKLTAYCS